MRIRTILVVAAVLVLGTLSAQAEPYWIAWEGDDFPENEGWTRVHGDSEGTEGEAFRTLEDGVLTYDSLHDLTVYDYSLLEMPGQIDPGPDEIFVIEWGLRVEQVVGILPRDPAVGLASDDGWLLSIEFFGDSVWSGFEAEEIATISATEWHDYRLESEDMRTYRFYIDGEFAHQGSFFEAFTQSSVSWGDLVRGAASKHRWDYIRFGAVPEPNVLLALTIATVALRRR